MPHRWHYWTFSWQKQDKQSSRQHHHVNTGTHSLKLRRKELQRGDRGKDKMWLYQVVFLDKRTNILQEPQELTSHPASSDSPTPTHCCLLIINHRPTINQSIEKPTQSHSSVINQSSLCGWLLLKAKHLIYSCHSQDAVGLSHFAWMCMEDNKRGVERWDKEPGCDPL